MIKLLNHSGLELRPQCGRNCERMLSQLERFLIIPNSVYFTVFSLLFLVSCGQVQLEQSEKQKSIADYSYEEFKRLPHDVQYALTFPDDVDSIITVAYDWIDTTFEEDGSPLRIKVGKRNCDLVLEKDTMKLYYPYKANLTFSFFTYGKLFDKRTNDFSNRFEFAFVQNNSKDYYYILKSDFPTNLCSDDSYENEIELGPYVEGLKPIEKKYNSLVAEIGYSDYTYRFQESYDLPKNMVSKDVSTWVVEENEKTKFKNWIRK